MNVKELKYWSLILLLSYIPAISFPYLIRPMWFKGADSFTSATSIQFLFSSIILPGYLLTINYSLAKKFQKLSEAFIINGLIILSCIFISTHFHFKNWADSIGSNEYPDAETLGVMDLERMTGIIITLIGLAIIYFRARSKNKISSGPAINKSKE